MRRFWLVLFLTLTSLRLTAQLVPGFTADGSRVDLNTGELVFSGNARATLGDTVLEADEVRYNARTRTATASGRVVLIEGPRRLLAEELTYFIDDRRYNVTDLRFGLGPINLSGRQVAGTPDSLTFRDARVSYGEPGAWAPTFVADRVTYFPERNRVRLGGARLGVGRLQPLPLPSLELPTNVSFLSYLSANGGYSASLGAFAEIGIHLPVAEGWNLGGEAAFFTNRGLLLGPSGEYRSGDLASDSWTSGSFSTGFIHDSGDKLRDILGERIPEDRGFATWEHRQQFNADLTLNLQANYWSASEVVRDFRPLDFFPVQVPDTFVDLTRTSDNTVLGLFLRAQPNPYHRVQQRLPELTFDLLPSPLPQGFVQRLHTSVAVLRDDPPDDPFAPPGAPATTLRSDRADAYYALTRPFTPREWLSVAPVAGGRLTHYNRALGNRSDYTRALGEVGLDAELRASGVYAYTNERWGIDGIRHLVTPRLSYRYIPEADKGRAYIPPIDRQVFATYLEPLGLGDRRNIDELSATNTLRLELGNRLQTRDATYGSRDLLAYTLAADLRFDQPTGERTLSDLHSDLRITPAPWISFDLYHRFEPSDGTMQELNTALVLRDANLWSLRLSNHYLKGDIQEYIADFRYRINEVYAAFTRHHFDVRRNRFIEQTYGISQVLDNRWRVGYELSFYEGPRRESSFGFNLTLDAVSF